MQLLGQHLVYFALVKELFFWDERPGEDDPYELTVGTVEADDAYAGGRSAQVKESRLDGEPA
jgi:hypothetical protein